MKDISNELIVYSVENDLSVTEYIELLADSELGPLRPIHDPDRIESMLNHSNLIITARLNNQLIGLSRSLTDEGFCTYVSDLVVRNSFKKIGIGRKLIKKTKNTYPDAMIVVLALPNSGQYYTHVGFTQYQEAFILKDWDEVT